MLVVSSRNIFQITVEKRRRTNTQKELKMVIHVFVIFVLSEKGRLAKVFETLDPSERNYMCLVVVGCEIMKTHHEIICSRVITGRFVLLKFTRQR